MKSLLEKSSQFQKFNAEEFEGLTFIHLKVITRWCNIHIHLYPPTNQVCTTHLRTDKTVCDYTSFHCSVYVHSEWKAAVCTCTTHFFTCRYTWHKDSIMVQAISRAALFDGVNNTCLSHSSSRNSWSSGDSLLLVLSRHFRPYFSIKCRFRASGRLSPVTDLDAADFVGAIAFHWEYVWLASPSIHCLALIRTSLEPWTEPNDLQSLSCEEQRQSIAL